MMSVLTNGRRSCASLHPGIDQIHGEQDDGYQSGHFTLPGDDSISPVAAAVIFIQNLGLEPIEPRWQSRAAVANLLRADQTES
jgi:hypothetical protein